MPEPFRYARKLIVLHWLTAGLIAAAWIGAQVIDLFPAALHPPVRSAHMLIGLVLGVILLIRIAVRASGQGGSPPQETGWMDRAARLAHLLLYVLMFAEITLGLANAWARGESLFGLFSLAGYAPDDRAMRRLIGGLHELAANAILAVAGFHAAAALFHHYVLGDTVLRRMLPGA